MKELERQIQELEIEMWEAVIQRDSEKYSKLVYKDAVMVCGGYRCSGKEYAEFVGEFDITSYLMEFYETVLLNESAVQNHYVVTTEVENTENNDLVGKFHVTSTWSKIDGQWQMIYNMDSRIIEG